ncbi:hypothetical protein A2348_01590 [Candidatus Uhrbacteria bacterium RIFOXYB12_FULL_58_10]|nr:MAG: hypothetical protein A2348_01590 [Candidatus Uhrbacteria bacterium RIFOXYB12_FULL_58_10]OGL99695.1 MAG: hypothetical protein A2501_00455 [Candidatus Uhrbacteria bacterium RIFOXYC12_FULL_57_11]
MISILDKFRTFTFSNLHSLLDAAIDLNSVEAIKQHVRDLETAHRDMLAALAGAKGNVSALKAQTTALEERIADLTEKIEILLSDGDATNDHYADPFGEQIGDSEEELAALDEEIGGAQAQVAVFEKAEGQIKSKVQQMHGELRRLASMERVAAAKEKAAGALAGATAALSSGVDGSVDSVKARLQQRAGTADATFEQAVDRLDAAGGAEAAVKKSIGASKVAEIRARLAAQKAAAQPA